MTKPVSLASSIFQTTTLCADDTTPPAKLGVSLARFGDIRDATAASPTRHDPLMLMLQNVEPGCRLEIINLSQAPDAEWSNKAEITALPGDTLRALGDGRYGLVLGNDAAKKLGIAPGDVFEVRQVDDAGNASESTRVKLDQRTGLRLQALVTFGALDVIEAPNVTVGAPIDYTPYRDARAPTVLTKNLRIEGSSPNGGVLQGVKAMEPGATVFIHNEATQQKFSAVVGEDGKVTLPFEAKVGHPLRLWVEDHNGNTTELGLTKYKPICAQAGLCNSASLLAQM